MGRELRPLERLGRKIASSQDAEIPSIVDEARARLATPPRSHAAPRVWKRFAAMAVAATLAAVVVLVLRSPPRSPLTFEIPSTPGEVGRWVKAPTSETLPMRFSDGATVLLSPETEGRVAEITPDGAHVAVARGRIAVSVPGARGARYRFEVGPFAVTVLGTRFDTSWDPRGEVFELDLHDGSVRVSGPTLEGEQVVVAGQHLRIALAIADVDDGARPDATSLTEPGSAPGAPDAGGTTDVDDRGRPTVALAPAASNPSGRVPWRRLSEEGRYAEALADVGPRFDALTETSPPADVIALADAARLAGDTARARRAYLAARRRFATTSAAALATFWLGRTALQDEDDAEAARWFETYLRERPNDRLAREALGRLMEVRDRRGERAVARSLAEQYLAAYPDGPHAKLARKLRAE